MVGLPDNENNFADMNNRLDTDICLGKVRAMV